LIKLTSHALPPHSQNIPLTIKLPLQPITDEASRSIFVTFVLTENTHRPLTEFNPFMDGDGIFDLSV